MTTKPLAAQLLDSLVLQYKILAFTPCESALSAAAMTERIGSSPDETFKTLVLKGKKRGPFVCVIPGNAALDMKKVRQVTGEKHNSFVSERELETLTGYARGSCTPIGMSTRIPVYIDSSAKNHNEVIVNSGKPGYVLKLALTALQKACGGEVVDLVSSAG